MVADQATHKGSASIRSRSVTASRPLSPCGKPCGGLRGFQQNIASRGLELRHEHGSQFMRDDDSSKPRFLGIEPSPACVCVGADVSSRREAVPGAAGMAHALPRAVPDRASRSSLAGCRAARVACTQEGGLEYIHSPSRARRRRYKTVTPAHDAPCRGLPDRTEYGGEGGIRTPGPVRDNGFQDRRLKPLGHLSDDHAANRRATGSPPSLAGHEPTVYRCTHFDTVARQACPATQ